MRVVAALPVGIGHDCLPAHFVEGDVLRRVACGGRDRHGRVDPLRVGRRPLQHLHPAHGTAQHREHLLDPKRVQEHRLGAHHVADGYQRKTKAVGFAGRRIDLARSGRPHAAADHVGADHEKPVGVDRLARSHGEVPPARLAGHRMDAGDELIARKRMGDEDGVGSLGIQGAVGHVGDGQRRKLLAGVEDKRALRAELEHLPEILGRRLQGP